MNSHLNVTRYTQADAQRWVGKRIRTTDDQAGTVITAHPSNDGQRVILDVMVSQWAIRSDNEHSTIERHEDSAHHYGWSASGDYVPED